MGLREAWNALVGSKPKEVEKKARYTLKRRSKKGGMVKVQEFDRPVAIEEIMEGLSNGIYALHKYETGKSGFEQVWGPVEVYDKDDEGEPATPKKPKGSAIEQMVVFAQGMDQMQKEAKKEFDILAPFFGYGTPNAEPKSFIEQMEEAKAQYNTLGGYFGAKTSGADPIKYEGTVPIWFHPNLIPELIDNSMDKVEKRLRRWGIIDDEEEKFGEDEDLPAYPEKPKPEPPELKDIETSVDEVEEEEPPEEPSEPEKPEETGEPEKLEEEEE